MKSGNIIERVAEIYDWIALQIHNQGKLTGTCSACGKCCNFDVFGHRLYITSLEVIYLAAKLDKEKIKMMTAGTCPYNIDGQCNIYEHRFAGCRIFCCKGNADFQSELTEAAIKKFKNICEKFKIPYHYADLTAALSDGSLFLESFK